MNNRPIPLLLYENLRQDPSTVFQNGEINIKSFDFHQGGYSINVADANSVSYLVNKLIAYYEDEMNDLEKESIKIITLLKRQLENEKSKYETLKKNLQNEHDIEMKRYQVAIEENKKYREWYGKLISPILIIKELWNEGQKAELDILVPPAQWKVGKGLGGEAGATAKRYWLSQFIEWGLIKQWGRGKYMSNVGMYEALEILNKMMKKQGLLTFEKNETDEKEVKDEK